MKKYGPFEVEGDLARRWLVAPFNVNGRPNSDVVKPWIAGRDITTRPQDRWVIDFGVECTDQEAACYELPFAYLGENARDLREKDRSNRTASNWWLFERSRPVLRARIKYLDRFLATVVVSKHRLFVWLPKAVLPSNLLDAIARDDDTTFGILHSRFHELWSLRMGTFLGVGNDPRYTPSTTFETFPFPQGLTPNIPALDYAADHRAQKIAAAAARLNTLRENWLNPADLVKRVREVVAGYPDRILPISPDAEKTLKTRTLTNLYNQRPTWLTNAHTDLDAAVLDAYGWPADLTDEAILERLLELNLQRAAA